MENETLNMKLLQSSILYAALKMKYFVKDVFSKCIKNVHWDTSISSQDWNCDGVMLEIFMDHKFQWPHEGLNSEILTCNPVT